MSKSYTHDLVDATAQLLEDYAHNIRKLVRLEHGERVSLSVDYERVNGSASQVLVIVYRDEDGDFFFNEHVVGDLKGALEFYAMACAPVIKEAALDEHGADRLEDVCRDFVDELRNEEDSESSRTSVSSDDALKEMLACFPSCETEGGNHTPSDDDDDDEIIENYHGGEFVSDESAQGDDAPAVASHPADEPGAG